MADTKRCKKCGNPVDLEVAQAHDGACPWCLAAFTFSPEPVGNPATASKDSAKQFGKYVRAEKLGAGGMGEVWKALDTELNRWVALKFLKDEDPSVVARFQREAKTAASLAHSNIASIYDVGEVDGRHFIAMQYVQGRTLGSFPRNDRSLLVRLFRDAAKALEHAHLKGIIHRDLKPENLMVEEKEDGWSVKVLDFGLARPIEGGEKLSQSGEVYGTAPYMSPEQARGEPLDERADVYGLGATMYDVLTGKTPFEGNNLLELIRKVGNDEPVRPRKLNPQIHRDLETIILKCLEKDRNRRYAGARELAEDLDRFLSHDPIQARPASTLYRLRMKLAKRRAVVVTAGIATVLLAAAVGWWLGVGRPRSEHLQEMKSGLMLWNEARVAAISGGDPAGIRARAKAARERFEGAIRSRETSEAHVLRARCLEMEGNDDEALAALERAHRLEPRNQDARTDLAKALFLKYQRSRGTPLVIHRLMVDAEAPTRLHIGDLRSESNEERLWRERGEKILADGEAAAPQKNLLKGLLAMGKGDYKQAAAALGAYAGEERWDSQAQMLQGLCLYFAKDFGGAVAAFDHSLSRVPRADGFHWRANAKENLGLPRESIEDQVRALEVDPRHVPAYVGMARVKLLLNLENDAIADLNKAIEIDPTHMRAYNGRGCVRGFRGQYDEAIAEFTKVIELDPGFAMGYTNRGFAKIRKKEFHSALADCTKALDLDPKLVFALVHRGMAKEELGLHDEAIADFTRAVEIEPANPWVLANRAKSLHSSGRHDEAIADCNKSIAVDPRSSLSYFHRGQARLALGLADDAISDFTKTLELDPKFADALCNRGVAKMRKSLWDEALADFEKAIDRDPTIARYYSNRGAAKAEKGELDDALEDFTKAIDMDARLPDGWSNRGKAREALGQDAGALEDFAKALAAAPPRWPEREDLEKRIRRLKEKTKSDY